MFIDPSVLLAYIDPGLGSMLLQAIVGGTAGMAVFGRYLWQTCISERLLRRH